ncbi:MAG: OstA-like protein [Bacteroidota bacterium]
MKKSCLYLLIVGCWLLLAPQGLAQVPPAAVQDTSTQQDTVNNKVIVDHADLGEFIQRDDRQYQKLSSKGRQVELRQGNTFMYCDTAVIEENNVTAVGNVIIQQGDTLSIFSDSLSYQGNEKIADLFGEVVLVNKDQKLFTSQLRYDMNTRIATYDQGAVLTNDTTQLISKIGYYHMKTNQAYFKDSVVVIDPEMTIRTDSLQFNTKTRITNFVGPTLIKQDSAQIYCESGFYNSAKKEAEFTQNAQYRKGNQEATATVIRYNGAAKEVILEGDARLIEGAKKANADRIRYQEDSEITLLEGNAHFEDGAEVIEAEEIRYDSKNEDLKTSGRSQLSDPPNILIADEIDYDGKLGKARGDVIWQDTAENTTIYCDVADYNKETDFLLAVGNRPLFVSIINEDSLFMRSDTLIAMRENPEDSARTMLAITDVRIFKSDLQATCDSLSYSIRDSLFQFFKDPVVWSDSSQFTADSIRMQLANNKIDKIFMREKSFINNTTDEIFFNQVKGKWVTAFFAQDSIRRVLVEGNAESVYYAQDEVDAYLGVNTTICSRMMLYFKKNNVDNILFYTEPKGKFMPMEKARHEELKLEGFRWENKRRPNSPQEL